MNAITHTETITIPAIEIKQPQPKQSAKEAIDANIKFLIEQLEHGHSEALTAHLTAIAPAYGVSYGGRIALLPGQPEAEEFATLVHELAHETMHKADQRYGITKTSREMEAEAVAFVVCKAIGLDAGRASVDYIHLYKGDAALLTGSLEAIQRSAAMILTAIEDDAPQPEHHAAFVN